MSTRITPPPTPVTITAAGAIDRSQINPSRDSATLTLSGAGISSNSVRSPLHLDPPKAERIPTAVANYQSRWEREKAKARADGTEIDVKDPKMIGPWVLGEMLGRGASGRVRLARHATSHKMAAVKILTLHPNLSSRASSLTSAGSKAEKLMLTAEREIAVMKLLDHPNIMKMYDVWSSPNELYIVLEYVKGGELFDYLCSRGSRLPILEAVSIIKQVLAGVHYCHRFNICHRDLKPENILLVNETVPIAGSTNTMQIQHVKIADFGMSTLDSLNGLLRTSCGSPHYASPEIVRGQMYSGAASDIWSCGVILFALVTSRLPFDDPNVNNVLRKVKDGRFTIPDWVIPEAKDLMIRMLQVDCNKRITMREIFSHPLMRMDTPGIILPPAPRLDEIALPVVKEDVDGDLLRNLCIIWREKDRFAMIERLCSEEKNFEKAFYFLLCRYRDRSFEEYNVEAATSTHALQLPTPVSEDFPRRDQNMSPIIRHFPGRPSPRISSSIKKSTRGPLGGYDDGSPVGAKQRDQRTRPAVNSPRKSRVLSSSSINSNSPRKGSSSSISRRQSDAPSSRTSTLRSVKNKGDGNRSRSGSTATGVNGTIGPASTRKAPTSPPRRISTTSEAKSPSRRASGMSSMAQSPRKPTRVPVLKPGSPRKSTTTVTSRVVPTPVTHRRAFSASAAIPAQTSFAGGTNGGTVQNRSRDSSVNNAPAPATGPQDSQLVPQLPLPNRSPIVVPTGIVQQRTSLLTSKLVAMNAESQSSHRETVPSTPTKSPSGASLPPTTPSGPSSGPLRAHQKSQPHIQRLPGGRIATPTRPLARMMMAPTIFSSDSPGARRSSIDVVSGPTMPARRKEGKSEERLATWSLVTSSNEKRLSTVLPSQGITSSHATKVGKSSNPLRTPRKSVLVPSVLDTPSKSPGRSLLSTPNRIRGLGFFGSPGRSTAGSPNYSSLRGNMEPLVDEDPTPKASALNPKLHVGSKQPLTEYGIPEEDGEDEIKPTKQPRKPTGLHSLTSDPTSGAAGIVEQSFLADLRSFSGHHNSGSSANMSGGRSSGDTGHSSNEAWEKVEWCANNFTSLEEQRGKPIPRPKKRPAPLDLFNPYNRDRRSRAPPSSSLTTPLETQRQPHSPLLVPFLGFAGLAWGGGSPAAPTPALISSSAMESGHSSGSSQVTVSSSGASRGMFARLFEWKAPTLSISSIENPVTTRKECARLLKCLNVAIVPSETGGFNCHVEDMLDKNGVRVTKSVHFRLEIEVITSSRPATPSLVRSMSFTANDRSSTSSSRSDWNTSLHIAASPPIKSSKLQPLIQDPVVSNDAQGMQVICNVLLILEKGANSTLRIVHERMQESWRLDKTSSSDASLDQPIKNISTKK